MAEQGLGVAEAGEGIADEGAGGAKPGRRRGSKALPRGAAKRTAAPGALDGGAKPEGVLEPGVGVEVKGERVVKDEQPRVSFNCNRCPAFCCSVYERVEVTKRDLKRLAKHFGVTPDEARERYTRDWDGERVLKRVDDRIFPQTCMFLDQKTRGCTVYHARPNVCRAFPGRPRCAYYDLLKFERQQQGDETVVPVVTITFREVDHVEVRDEDSSERIYEWGAPTGEASDKGEPSED